MLFLILLLLLLLSFLLFWVSYVVEREGEDEGAYEDHGQGRHLQVAFGLPGQVRFTISPLQRNEGHIQAIKIIDIDRHKQRVMYSCIY